MKVNKRERSGFSWRIFWILFGAGVFGATAAVPAVVDIFGAVVHELERPPFPLPLLIFIGVVQNLVLLGLFVGVGLLLADKVGLGPRLIQSWRKGEFSVDQLWSVLSSGIGSGVLVGVVLLTIMLILVSYLPNLPFVAAAKISIWKRFLLCFYGGLYEEILSRLFLLSLFAWLINRSWRKKRGYLSGKAFWSANLIVAILFGLGHLPSASLLMPITALVVVAALTLNGFAALVLGWLYRQRGLEAAMIAHFVADFVIYVIGPQFLRV
jgi:membrane protease YdiL (CAAX protease family)